MSNESIHILLFEDNIETMSPVKEHLVEDWGFSVELTAEEGIIERLGQERFDLIIVDLMIASTSEKETANVHFDDVDWHRTGLEFVKRLRRGEFCQEEGEGTPVDVPVLILSAVADVKTIKEDLAEEDYLAKPFLLDDIDNYITNLFGV